MTRTDVSFLCVTDRIFHSGFAKTFEPQETGIAFGTGETFGRGIVTAVCERKIDTELDGFADNFCLRKFDERRVDLKVSAFDACFCPKAS